MRVEQVDFISIPTRDVERAAAWYRDVLGLPESDVSKGEVETPNVTLSFWEPERENLPFVANTAGFAVRVPDVAEARAELKRMGSSSSVRLGTPVCATSQLAGIWTATP